VTLANRRLLTVGAARDADGARDAAMQTIERYLKDGATAVA
jgi:hypothetical protein